MDESVDESVDGYADADADVDKSVGVDANTNEDVDMNLDTEEGPASDLGVLDGGFNSKVDKLGMYDVLIASVVERAAKELFDGKFGAENDEGAKEVSTLSMAIVFDLFSDFCLALGEAEIPISSS